MEGSFFDTTVTNVDRNIFVQFYLETAWTCVRNGSILLSSTHYWRGSVSIIGCFRRTRKRWNIQEKLTLSISNSLTEYIQCESAMSMQQVQYLPCMHR